MSDQRKKIVDAMAIAAKSLGIEREAVEAIAVAPSSIEQAKWLSNFAKQMQIEMTRSLMIPASALYGEGAVGYSISGSASAFWSSDRHDPT